MTCTNCGNTDIVMNTQQVRKPRGCLTIGLYILLAITILGWLIIIPLWLWGGKKVLITTCVCKNCGNKWQI